MDMSCSQIVKPPGVKDRPRVGKPIPKHQKNSHLSRNAGLIYFTVEGSVLGGGRVSVLPSVVQEETPAGTAPAVHEKCPLGRWDGRGQVMTARGRKVEEMSDLTPVGGWN